MTYEPGWTKARVLYSDAFYDNVTTLTVGGAAEVAGFEAINAIDWRDWTDYKQQLNQWLKVQVAANTPIDSLVVWRWAQSPGSVTFLLEWSNDNISWTSLGSFVSNAELQWFAVTPFTVPAGKWLRITSTLGSGGDVRVISCGLSLTFPVGQWAGLTPPTLYHGVVMENQMAVNGSILGRNLRRFQKDGNIQLNLLTQDWVRTYWDPFMRAAAKHAFWYQWNPTSYPAEIAFAVAKTIQPAMNDKPPPRMKVDLPMTLLTSPY